MQPDPMLPPEPRESLFSASLLRHPIFGLTIAFFLLIYVPLGIVFFSTWSGTPSDYPVVALFMLIPGSAMVAGYRLSAKYYALGRGLLAGGLLAAVILVLYGMGRYIWFFVAYKG